MADTRSGLTPKQARVYGMLGEGLNVKEIAERMKVTPQAIRLHMNKISNRGVELPGDRASDPSGQAEQPPVSTDQPAATNDGAADNGPLDAMVRKALEARLGEIDRQRDELATQEEKYRTALAALT